MKISHNYIYKKDKMTTLKGAYANLVRNFLLSFLFLLVKNVEEKIESSNAYLDIANG